MSLRIELPFPPRVLHPNARPHWTALRRASKQAKADAWALTRAAGGALIGQIGSTPPPYRLSLTFCPPNARRRDMDGMLSASKPLLDGVAAALLVDDSDFELTLTRGPVVKGGKVVVEIA